MNISRGKQFEGVIKKAFLKVKDVSVDRLHDQMTGYMGSRNISDFIVYQYPYQYYFECKTTNTNTLPLSNITDNQLNGMLEKAQLKGVSAGVICWWINNDETWFIPAWVIQSAIVNREKSLNIKKPFGKEYWVKLNGEKKRIFYEYDMKQFLDDLWEIREGLEK